MEWGAIEEGEMRGVAVEVAGCRWARAESDRGAGSGGVGRQGEGTSVREAEIKDDRRLFSRILLHRTSEFAMATSQRVVLFYIKVPFGRASPTASGAVWSCFLSNGIK